MPFSEPADGRRPFEHGTEHQANISLSYNEPIWYMDNQWEIRIMLIVNAPLLFALAALVTSVSGLVWSLRRKR